MVHTSRARDRRLATFLERLIDGHGSDVGTPRMCGESFHRHESCCFGAFGCVDDSQVHHSSDGRRLCLATFGERIEAVGLLSTKSPSEYMKWTGYFG